MEVFVHFDQEEEKENGVQRVWLGGSVGGEINVGEHLIPFEFYKAKKLTDKEELVLSLEKQYPDDVGFKHLVGILHVKILCSMLTYKQGFPEIMHGVQLNPYTTRYIPPFEEFEVDRCILSPGKSVVFPSVPSPSIFIVITGWGKMHTVSSEDEVSEGDVLFAPASTEIHVSTTAELHMYKAGLNSRFLHFEQHNTLQFS